MRGTPMERSQTVNLASRAIMSIVVCAWLFSTTIACQDATHQLHESDCEKIDPRLEGPDLLDRFEAERIAVQALNSASPGVSAVEIRNVDAACLTTLRWFERDLLKGKTVSKDTLNKSLN